MEGDTIMDEKEALTRMKKDLPTLGRRHFFTLMMFLGMANAYVMRTNMSVAIVAMVKHDETTTAKFISDATECSDDGLEPSNPHQPDRKPGEFAWSKIEQGYILSSFFYGYVLTQVPFALLSNEFGALHFLGWGMLINSAFAFLVPVAARLGGTWALCGVRFVQGLGEGPIVPCTHALLAKWIPQAERSRLCTIVYAGAQFGTIVSMPISGLLASCGWPHIFYVFGVVGVVWSVAFLVFVYEDPAVDRRMAEAERQYIALSIGGRVIDKEKPPVPFRRIFGSWPFLAILSAHCAQNYGYETLMTQLPTYMNEVLHFSIKENGFYSALPYLSMFFCSLLLSTVADYMIGTGRFTNASTRKIMNSVGQYGPAICLVVAAYTGCNRYLTVVVLTLGMGLNGGIYSGFKVNHIDLSRQYAGVLMSFTNCAANFIGMLAPLVASSLTPEHKIAQWRIVFFLCAGVYFVMATVYNIFASGMRQPWDKITITEK